MIIGIGGVSRSGKSELASHLSQQLAHSNVISQDDYGLGESLLPKIGDRYDWEIPQAYNFTKLVADVLSSKNRFDFTIVEGILIYHHLDLKDLFDLKFFLEIDGSTFLKRRLAEKRWGPEPKWFIRHVWNTYLKYGVFTGSDVIRLSGEKKFDVKKIISKIKTP